MSTLKTPRQKKLASLALDRRNVYGENDKSSRKAIPLRKRLAHQASRRAAKLPFLHLDALGDTEVAENADLRTKNAELEAKLKGFKKKPDAPLGAILRAKESGTGMNTGWESKASVYRELLEPEKRSLDRS